MVTEPVHGRPHRPHVAVCQPIVECHQGIAVFVLVLSILSQFFVFLLFELELAGKHVGKCRINNQMSHPIKIQILRSDVSPSILQGLPNHADKISLQEIKKQCDGPATCPVHAWRRGGRSSCVFHVLKSILNRGWADPAK